MSDSTSVLLLCFDAPMQSWGTRSHGVVRDTATEPTKSGVIGVLGAALGVDRTEDERLADLATLSVGVRVDREGIIERDFQTAQNVPTTTGGGHRTVISERFYLADALFLVALGGDDPGLLQRIAEALRRPRWRPHFGRSAFVPARPILIEPGEPTESTIEQALKSHRWLVDSAAAHQAEAAKPEVARLRLRIVLECPPTTPKAEPRLDQPISFAPGRRQFATRYAVTTSTCLTDDLLITDDPEEPACS